MESAQREVAMMGQVEQGLGILILIRLLDVFVLSDCGPVILVLLFGLGFWADANTGTLAAHLNDENPEEANVAMALGNVAVVTGVDIYCARRLSCSRVGGLDGDQERYDYSDRSGFPKSAEAVDERSTPHVGNESAAQQA
jgi:hypothetical protein